MAAGPAQYRLRRLQRAPEASLGAGGPATFQIVGDWTYTPQDDRYFSDYPRGVRAPVTAGGVSILKGGALQVTSELTYEEILDPLSSLATEVASGTTPLYTHTFTPILTADPAPKSLYYEFVETDGASNIFASSAAAGLCSQFTLDWAFNQKANLSYTMFLRAETAAITPTAALTPLTGREVVVSNLFKVFIDDTWAGLGGTLKSTLVRSGKLVVNTGLTPDYTTDGRANLDYTRYNWGEITGTLDLVCEFDADATAEIVKWRSKSLRFIRLKNTSPNTLGSGHRDLQLDCAMVYAKPPAIAPGAKATGTQTVSLNLAFEYDPTSAKVLLPVIQNGLATFS